MSGGRKSAPANLGHRHGRHDMNRVHKESRYPAQNVAAAALQKMADQKKASEPAGNEPRLRISLDYGTSTCIAAVLVYRPGEEITPGNVHTVSFSGRAHWAPQLAAWDADGKFYSGYEVEAALDQQVLQPGDVIDFWKVLLYKGHENSPISRRIRQRLGKHTLDELLTTHFAALLTQVKTWVKTAWLVVQDCGKTSIDDMAVELFLSVPQMWKPPANKRLSDAAYAAGVAHVKLVPEPQCAAAYYTSHFRHRLPHVFNRGDVLIVADIGGGTGDFVSVAYESPPSDGAKARLKTVCDPKGEMCGSEFINENFLQYIQEKAIKEVGPGGLEELFENHLGIPAAQGISEAMEAFEAHKQAFKSLMGKPKHITINGAQRAKRADWKIKIESELMASFFEPIIQQIFDCINHQIREIRAQRLTPKGMLVPGGFGRSDYFLDRAKEKYDHEVMGQQYDAVGSYEPVARGALYRFADITTRPPPSEGSFIIGRTEVYDPEKHLDANLPDATPTSANRPSRACRDKTAPKRPNMEIVEANEYHRETLDVHGRAVILMKKGEIKQDGKVFTTCWLQCYVTEEDKVLYQQIYYTEADMQESNRIQKTGYAPSSSDAVLFDHIEEWGSELTFPLPNLAKHGYKLQDCDAKDPVYELCYRLKLVCDGINISVSFQLAKDTDKLYTGGAFDQKKAKKAEMWEEDMHEIVAATHNPVPCTEPS